MRDQRLNQDRHDWAPRTSTPLGCTVTTRDRAGDTTPIAPPARGSVQSGFNEVAIRALAIAFVARPHRSLQIPRRGLDVIQAAGWEEAGRHGASLFDGPSGAGDRGDPGWHVVPSGGGAVSGGGEHCGVMGAAL